MSVAPYPHVEIGVRDDSIYIPTETEVLPLHKPLYMMRTVKGPVGVPVWCPTYTAACRTFGEDTFNKRSTYFSEQAYFLLKTFPSNGAFIMRVADSDAKTAEISIELGVSKTDQQVPQWLRDANGRFMLELDGSKIPINSSGEECATLDHKVDVYARALESVAIAGRNYYTRNANWVYSDVVFATRRIKGVQYFKGVGLPHFTKVTATEEFSSKEYYFEKVTEGADAGKYLPKQSLTAFAEGKEYFKFAGFAAGYSLMSDSELPEIPPGSTQGDRFLQIDLSAVTISDTGAADSADETKYASYKFTRDLDATTPYSYVAVTLPAGTAIDPDTPYYYYVGQRDAGDKEPQATIPGVKLAWRAHVRGTSDTRPIGSAETKESDNFKWYPMIDIVADNPGCWGKNFGIKLFFDPKNNTIAGTVQNTAVTYTIAPVQLLTGETVPTPITDAYAQTMVTGVMKKGIYDPETDVELTIDKRLVGSYKDNYALPINVTLINENWHAIGKQLMAKEIAVRNQVKILYPNFRQIATAEGDMVPETYVDALFEKVAVESDFSDDTKGLGYMSNPVSLIDSENIPYFASMICDNSDDPASALVRTDTLIDPAKVVVPTAETAIYLGGGEDGDVTDFAIEKYIRAQITAAMGQTQEYLVDYARCPYNSIIDTGVSLKTKKAYLDFLTVRDSLVVNLSTQSTWKKEDGTTPAVNSRFDDESIGTSLRAYAWLMKEDVANGTEACRAKIFLHAGWTSDHEGPVASTLWMALKDAEYLNRTYIYKEAKELPNADVSCYTKLSWVAASEDTKSRCWNAGLNYVQYYNMKNIHYASVRSVYRYETSILVDSGVVNALTFMKDEVRRSWATFAGSTRPAAELNQLITDDLAARFSFLLNGKYNYAVNVYQTDEDMKLGYVRHVDIQLIAPATNRVWLATIICKRENFEPQD